VKPARTTTLKITAVRGDVSVEVRSGGRGGELLWAGQLVKGHSQMFKAARLWIRVSAVQNIRWTLPGGISTDSGNRFGPRTVIFTPTGHRFITG